MTVECGLLTRHDFINFLKKYRERELTLELIKEIEFDLHPVIACYHLGRTNLKIESANVLILTVYDHFGRPATIKQNHEPT